jgi:hypothetical protein
MTVVVLQWNWLVFCHEILRQLAAELPINKSLEPFNPYDVLQVFFLSLPP